MDVLDDVTPVNIWIDIEKTFVVRYDIVFEGRSIVGIHQHDFENAITDIDELCAQLQTYKNELELIYGVQKKFTHRSKVGTFIYLMHCNITSLYKIGRSINPEFREKTILSQQPNISTVFVSPLTDLKTEKALHKLFSAKRVRGEWFRLSEEDIELIKSYDYSLA